MCKEIPVLTASDVELRASQITKTNYGVYVNLLVYKDARVDMRVLDAVFGPMNWQRKQEVVNGNLFCTISVWDDDKKQWISKQDVGTESNTEATKGESSDAFKRAGFCWGIGRELYNAPQIRFKLDDKEVAEKNGRVTTYAKFRVAAMEYDKERQEYTVFDVIDKDGNLRFSLGKKPVKQEVRKEPAPPPVDKYVKDYKGRTCVFLLNKCHYLDRLGAAELNVIINGADKDKYADCLDEALNRFMDIKKGQGDV